MVTTPPTKTTTSVPLRSTGASSKSHSYSKLSILATILLGLIGHASARAILGVDLGSLYMKVALVQSGAPLEIVTNMHSKRKTEQMVLFDAQQRFYGADASALLARKSQKTPAAMTLLLGRDDEHPVVRTLSERHFPVTPVYNETRSGVVVTVDGQEFTPEELVAMVLQHAVDISVAHAESQGSTIAPPKDIVLTVPAYATHRERRALLDAASLAELNVLTLIDETTAAALQYAMDKQFPEESIMLFYNMGGSSLQVSLVRFFNYEQPQKYGKPKTVPALEVLAKAWDETLGGLSFDHLVVEYLADQFNAIWQKAGGHEKDVRAIPRAMTKLRIQANKVKHVLSANLEIPIYMESVHDDVSLSTHMTRAQLEEMAAPLLARAVKPIAAVLESANLTIDKVNGTELLGGGMRIPSIQEGIQKALGEKLELGKHMNGDESMALGAAFAGANISTAFRVRQVGMVDINPFPLSVKLEDMPGVEVEDEWKKETTIFKAFGKLGVKKTIAFTHERSIHCSLDYEESEALPTGTELPVERYNVTGVEEFAKEMSEKGLGKPKVSLQFELSSSGIISLLKAEAAVEETYMAEVEVEVDDDDAADEAKKEDATDETKDGDAEEVGTKEEGKEEGKKEDTEAGKKDDDAKEEKKTEDDKKDAKKAKKPKKTIKVEKEKKRVHKRPLKIESYQVGRVQPHSPELLEESKAKLIGMAMKDKERMMLEASKNKVESYIYRIKNKLVDDEEILSKFSTEAERDDVKKLAVDAEDWLYDDGYTADLPTMEDKYAEISVPFEKILLRVSESTARPEAVEKLKKRLSEIEVLMSKWKVSQPHITDDERTGVLDKVEEVRKWIEEKESEQSKKKLTEEPAFLSTDVPSQSKEAEVMVVKLSKKPKPKVEKKSNTTESNATDANSTESNETDANSTESNESDANSSSTEEKVEATEEGADDATAKKAEGDDEL